MRAIDAGLASDFFSYSRWKDRRARWKIGSSLKDLPISANVCCRPLYGLFREVEQDLKNVGLGMPTTFACMLSRLNSSDAIVVKAEQDRFEAIITWTHT